MRDIRFRAWDKKNGVLLPVTNWIFPNHHGVGLLELKNQPANHEARYGYGELETMQYTGLQDKNGKEDYESDILLIPDTYKDVVLDDGSGPVEPFNHLAPIVFKDGTFGVDILEGGDDFSKGFWSFERIRYETDLLPSDIENIGNIWESPELLEVKSGDKL